MRTITLDWLAFTFKEDTHEASEWIQLFASDTSAVDCAPTNGYRAAYSTVKGIRVMWNVDRPEMGTHVIIPGSAIQSIVEHQNVHQKALLKSVCDARASITRLDLAYDLQGEIVSLDEIYKALERKENKGTARTFSQIHSVNGGNTVYVGSRQSEKFIRIYDKAAQLGAKNEAWFRYELETKGMVARSLASYLIQGNDWGDGFVSIASGMVSLPSCGDYQKFFDGEMPEIGIPKMEKETDREKWIREQVAPAVIKHYTQYRGSDAIRWLREMLDYIDNTSVQL